MTILNILSKDEIRLFEKPPQFSPEERHYFFTLPAWAEEELLKIQTPVNKVGFILQFGYFHAVKKFYPKSLFPETNVLFVSKGVGLKHSISVKDYANTTLQRQRKIILEKLGYQAFSEKNTQLLTAESDFLFSKQVRLKRSLKVCCYCSKRNGWKCPTTTL